ncbi:Uncharacterized membrane protein YjgN, DUF898 family [Rhizobium sp. RU20A]|uniref:YjgN family protein n=1 Tax=Rhizobium sp. RU20A TaxID=1907412 RepID=UPI0009563EE7|nr:DUF898 family protein [Rhizobium sp. RU20A]SIQ53358.1 Uncharacterized membrane protein YjgN, DUF898 family [Rhizobium sp. RU20A]
MTAIDSAAPSVAAAGPAEAFHRVSFTGSGKEYFGIWIVNILLTIITLGIYSAWAKVRRNRYFYGNTMLLGRGFEYHARGWQILVGRVIVVGYFILYNVALTVFPIAGLVLGLLIVLALPWLVMRGIRFSARVTSYRNVRFNFVGGIGGAFLAFMVGPVITVLTLGILAPIASRWVGRYVGNNLRWGSKTFATDPPLAPIYGTWFVAALVVLLGIVILAVGAFLNSALIIATIDGSGTLPAEFQASMIAAVIFAYVAIFITFGLASLVYRAGVRNVVWSATTLEGGHQILSDLPRFGYAWVAISNIILTILTLGFYRPWAAVRLARYTYEHTAVRFNGPVGDVMAPAEKDGSAVGAEFVSFEGFDFGF